MKRYLSIICNNGYTKTVNIYDLFCGEGVYANGGEGSPLVIMRAVKDVYFTHYTKNKSIPNINVHFNDLDKMKVNKTKQIIQNNSLHYPKFGKLTFSSMDYKNCLTRLSGYLSNLKNEKAFVFIDPYEYKHIRVNHVKSLIENGKTEVLLWLPTQFMYRFEKNATPTALKDFIEEIVSIDEWDRSSSGWTFINKLKNGFQNAIGDIFFVDSFSIEKSKNEFYSLFFFTSHIKGFEKMLESKWKIDKERGRGWNYKPQQINLFSQQITNALEIELTEFLKESPRTNGEIYTFTLRQGFLPKHTVEILRAWQQSNKIRVTLEDGKIARKNAYYLSYDNYKGNPNKVTIKK